MKNIIPRNYRETWPELHIPERPSLSPSSGAALEAFSLPSASPFEACPFEFTRQRQASLKPVLALVLARMQYEPWSSSYGWEWFLTCFSSQEKVPCSDSSILGPDFKAVVYCTLHLYKLLIGFQFRNPV
jgi:hypothetical protein